MIVWKSTKRTLQDERTRVAQITVAYAQERLAAMTRDMLDALTWTELATKQQMLALRKLQHLPSANEFARLHSEMERLSVVMLAYVQEYAAMQAFEEEQRAASQRRLLKALRHKRRPSHARPLANSNVRGVRRFYMRMLNGRIGQLRYLLSEDTRWRRSVRCWDRRWAYNELQKESSCIVATTSPEIALWRRQRVIGRYLVSQLGQAGWVIDLRVYNPPLEDNSESVLGNYEVQLHTRQWVWIRFDGRGPGWTVR